MNDNAFFFGCLVLLGLYLLLFEATDPPIIDLLVKELL